jgi:hypothetical protein
MAQFDMQVVHGKALGLNCRENAQKSQKKAFDGHKGTRESAKDTMWEAATKNELTTKNAKIAKNKNISSCLCVLCVLCG